MYDDVIQNRVVYTLSEFILHLRQFWWYNQITKSAKCDS